MRRSGVAAVLAMVVAMSHAQAEIPVFAQSVAEFAAATEGLTAWYGAAGWHPLWTAPDSSPRREALFEALERAGDHGLPVARYDLAGLRAGLRAVATERDRAQMEVALTRAYLAYARDLTSGALTPHDIDRGIVREIHRPDPAALLTGIASDRPAAFLRSLVPQAPAYAQLMRERLSLVQAMAHGLWGPQVLAGSLKPGDSGTQVVALRNRLISMGYLPRTATASYDGALQSAVQRFQREHGLEPDGVATAGTIAEINQEPVDRLKAVTVAMERLRWMNGLPLGQRHIWVNLTDFTAQIVDDGKVSFETVTVVGQNADDTRSPEFSDQMELIVINPSWSVPRSITVKEYLPMLRSNPWAVGHLDVVDRNGRVVERGSVNFGSYSEKTFPFALRQQPSDGNALGLVKFLFPNQWNIYLHDTPSKSLFSKEVRAFSHGCIRVGRPFDLAYALLGAQEADPEAFFQRILRSGAETGVRLKEPVPVHLVYFTAWPDARGNMEYRRDVYGRDAALWKALLAAGLPEPGVSG